MTPVTCPGCQFVFDRVTAEESVECPRCHARIALAETTGDFAFPDPAPLPEGDLPPPTVRRDPVPGSTTPPEEQKT